MKNIFGFKILKLQNKIVVDAHKHLFEHVNKKMQKLKLGLKSYRYFDQAKELADKLGVVLNESLLRRKVVAWLYQFIVQLI